MLDAVIFDLDGTLGDTLPLCIESFRRTVRDLLGKELEDEEIECHFGPSDLGVIQRLFPDNPELVRPGMARMMEHYRALHSSMAPAPFDGAVKLLGELKRRGVILAMVTGKCKETADFTLEEFGMREYFPMVEPGSPRKVIKGKCIARIADHYGLGLDNVIYVGDAVSDIVACREVGVPIVAAAWASSAKLDAISRHQPDYLFENFTDFEKFLITAINR